MPPLAGCSPLRGSAPVGLPQIANPKRLAQGETLAVVGGLRRAWRNVCHGVAERDWASDDDEPQRSVQSGKILGIRGQHPVAPSLRAQHDRGVDDVRGPRNAAELPSRPRAVVVERLEVHDSRAQQASESRLPPTVTPHLPHDARRHRESHTGRERTLEYRDPAAWATRPRDLRKARRVVT